MSGRVRGSACSGTATPFEQPFSPASYTDKLARDQQARNVQDVVNNDPSIRTNVPAFSGILGFFIRGFPVFAQDIAFNGFYGVADSSNPMIEPIERGEEPFTRATLGYASDTQVYKAVDIARRFENAKEWGIRFNGAFNNGGTPIDN